MNLGKGSPQSSKNSSKAYTVQPGTTSVDENIQAMRQYRKNSDFSTLQNTMWGVKMHAEKEM